MIRELELSLDYYRFQARLGSGPFIRGVDYSRSIEYPLVSSRMQIQAGDTVLDVGGGWSTFALFLAATHPLAHFTVTDLSEEVLAYSEDYIPRLSLKNIDVRIENGAALTFSDESFDRISGVSALEHFAEDGDIKAVAEFARVLRPGGSVIITVPYSPWFSEDSTSDQFGYQRHYDAAAIRERLIDPSGLKVGELVYFDDKLSFGENVAYRPLPLIGGLRDRVIWHLSPLLAPLLCRLHDTPPAGEGGALLVLRK